MAQLGHRAESLQVRVSKHNYPLSNIPKMQECNKTNSVSGISWTYAARAKSSDCAGVPPLQPQALFSCSLHQTGVLCVLLAGATGFRLSVCLHTAGPDPSCRLTLVPQQKPFGIMWRLKREILPEMYLPEP